MYIVTSLTINYFWFLKLYHKINAIVAEYSVIKIYKYVILALNKIYLQLNASGYNFYSMPEWHNQFMRSVKVDKKRKKTEVYYVYFGEERQIVKSFRTYGEINDYDFPQPELAFLKYINGKY